MRYYTIILAFSLQLLGFPTAAQQVPLNLAGPASSVPKSIEHALRQPSGDLSFAKTLSFRRGRILFDRSWIDIPRSSHIADSCVSCHAGGGRSGLQRVDLPATQTNAVIIPASAYSRNELFIRWVETEVHVDHKTSILLQKPLVVSSQGVAIDAHIRIAPPLSGVGLIESFFQSGKGRDDQRSAALLSSKYGFGWTADRATLVDTVIHALETELGVSKDLVSMRDLADLISYSKELGVPFRQKTASARGFMLFEQIGCNECHTPKIKVDRVLGDKTHSYTIWPFSDYRLHDLGRDLSRLPVGTVRDQLWRTPPLWALGTSIAVLGYASLMHDGRAASVREAIYWHGGEASVSRLGFHSLREVDQDALIDFLLSL